MSVYFWLFLKVMLHLSPKTEKKTLFKFVDLSHKQKVIHLRLKRSKKVEIAAVLNQLPVSDNSSAFECTTWEKKLGIS